MSVVRRCLAVVAFIFSLPAAALDPAVAVEDYHHTVWTSRDGAPSNIEEMAQTADGWLWLKAHDALYRFDGLRFERYVLPKQDQPGRARIELMHALADGSLLLTYKATEGISILHPDGSMDDIVGGVLRVELASSATQDADGGVWLSTASGLLSISHGKYRYVGAEEGLPKGRVCGALFDRQGQLWVLHMHGLYLRKAGGKRFEKLAEDVEKVSLISNLTQSPDGRIWLAGLSKENPWLRPLSAPVAGAPAPRLDSFNSRESQLNNLFDRDGNLWSWNCPQRTCRIAGAGKSTTPVSLWPQDAAGQNANGQLLEDSEGNIWIASQAGLERYRENKLIPSRVPRSSKSLSLVTDDAGQVWMADAVSAVAWRLSSDAAPLEDRSQPFRIAANDRNGGLLLGGRREIVRRYQGREERIPLPPHADGTPGDQIVLGLQDDGRVLWMYAPEVGLMGYVDGQWQPRSHFHLPPVIMLTTPGGAGRLWIACPDLSVVLYDNDKLTRYDASMIGVATSLQYGEEMIAAGDQGIAVLKGQRFHALKAANPDVLRNVTGLTTTADGDRWINGSKGVVHVRRGDWQASMANPGLPLRYELIGEADGYTGAAATDNRLHTALTDAHGVLWFNTNEGVIHYDPRQDGRKEAAPRISLISLNTPDASHLPVNGLRLPAGLHSLNIRYTAPGASKPEGVRFVYRLAGEDSSWQDGGDRRAAYYTNLSAGPHRFEVRAVNADGVWSAAPAVLDFEIEPTLLQTGWFRALCLLAALLALYLFYRYRLSVATASMEERMRVRLAERERIARTLHDSFLQSVQSLILTLDQAVHTLPPDSALHATLAPTLNNARATINQGRDQVYELRSGQTDDIESALSELTRLMAIKYPGIVFRLVVDGTRRSLRPRVADEVVEIASEAVRNAYQHAHAGQVMVRVAYAADGYALTVKDDGVGMADPLTGGADADRHWGLRGMRERSGRIGATLDIASHPGEGTVVTLKLAGRLAYGAPRHAWLRRLLRPWRRN